MKKWLFFSFLLISILAMAVSLACLKDNQGETYGMTIKPTESQSETVVGKKNIANLNTNAQFGMVRIRGKF
ncbi:MAG TPA: hypothetical protein P5232_04025 [Candidatus Moranbacteria bacterium]|nr:hypothetical protein [Candidatus Moranbacteria bacterium]